MNLLQNNFWKGKKVLVTGHTGFKGSWIILLLDKLGAEVTGISLSPETTPNLFTLAKIDKRCKSHICDIRSEGKLNQIISKTTPEIVFHLAAQPLVHESYANPSNTYSTNVIGTVNILEALRTSSSVCSIVMVTTDKVYRNEEWLWPYRENDKLGGRDPYSASKAASEIIIDSYRDSFFAKKKIALSTARAGNVIGGGDWSADRLIPDTIKAWHNNQILHVRRPNATRPWQHVLDPLFGYLKLAQATYNDIELAGAYNFGPPANSSVSVSELIKLASRVYGNSSYEKIKFSESLNNVDEASKLSLDITKSKHILQFQPRWNLREAITRTMHWYRAQAEGADAYELCQQDIEEYGKVL